MENTYAVQLNKLYFNISDMTKILYCVVYECSERVLGKSGTFL